MIRTTCAFILITMSWFASAADVNQLNPIEKISVEPEAFKVPMEFNITLPASYHDEKDKRYFVLFDLHPRSQPYLSGLHDWLSHNGEWPWLETIIVTPSGYHKEFATLFEETVTDPSDKRLLNFLESQVLKSVDEKYRTNGFKIYSGFMSNGAIGLYALLNRPKLFDAYMISSPTLSGNFLSITADADKKLPLLTDKIRFLYLTIGQHRYEEPHLEAVTFFKDSLREKAEKELEWEVDTDDKHYYMSRPVFTVLKGIEKLFDDYHTDLAPNSAISVKGVDAIVSYYDMLSEKKYGFSISAEGSLKKLAESFLKSDPERAINIYQQVVEFYPGSAYAYSDLAAAYQSLGQLEKAVDYQTKAVEKSAKMIKWHQNKLKKLLDGYKSELEDTKLKS